MDGNSLRRDSDEAAPDSPVAQQAAGYEFCGVDSDCETDSLCRQNRRRVDSDDVATRVDERTAGISRIQGGIGLNDILNQPAGVGPERSAESADHSRGYGRLKSVWIANRNRDLARPQMLRISEGHGLQSGNIHANHSQIGCGIVADDMSGSPSGVGESHLDPRRVVHYMAVGKD